MNLKRFKAQKRLQNRIFKDAFLGNASMVSSMRAH